MAYAEQAAEKSRSRIQADTQLVLEMVKRVEATRERIIAHARALGYFEPPPTIEAGAKVSPVSTTMADAIRDLDRALDHLAGSLNVFD